jgi:hypothetical protein
LCILHEGYQSSLQCWCCLERIAEEINRSNHPRDINLVNIQTVRNEIQTSKCAVLAHQAVVGSVGNVLPGDVRDIEVYWV